MREWFEYPDVIGTGLVIVCAILLLTAVSLTIYGEIKGKSYGDNSDNSTKSLYEGTDAERAERKKRNDDVVC